MKRLHCFTLALVVVLLVAALVLSACQTTPTPSPKPSPSPAPSPSPSPSPSPKPSPSPTPSPTATENATEFYKKNTISIVVPFSAGGGTDYSARIFAVFWSDVTGGTAKIINKPGGGGATGMNATWDSKPDGLTLGSVTYSTIAFIHFFKDPGMKFEMAKFNWMGWFAPEPYVLSLGKDSPYKTAADLQKVKGLKAASTGRTFDIAEALTMYILDLQDAKVITGYAGTPEVSLAAAKGEADFMTAPAATMKDEIDKGLVRRPFVQLDTKRGTLYPDVPAITEIATMNPTKQKFLDIWSLFGTGRVFYAPTGVPKERVDFLQNAFVKVVTFPGFVQTAQSRYGPMAPHATGKDVAAWTDKLLNISAKDFDEFLKVMDTYVKR